MAETATVGELLIRIRADVNQLEAGLKKAEGLTTGLATRTAPGLRAVQNAFAALGFQAAGLPGPIGRLSRLLLMFAAGGVVTLGVVAGIGAIGLAWKKLRADADELRKAADEAIKSLIKLPEAVRVSQDVATARQRFAQVEREMQLIAGTGAPPEGISERLFRLRFYPGTAAGLNKMRELVVEWGRLAGAIAAGERSLRQFATTANLEAVRGLGLVPTMAAIPGGPETREERLQRRVNNLLGIPQEMPAGFQDIGLERFQARVNEILRRMPRLPKVDLDIRRAWRELGFTIGDYFLEGFRAATEGGIGGFLKSLGFTLLRGVIFGAITTATGGTFAAGFATGTGIPIPAKSGGGGGGASAPQLNFSNFPAATNPLAAARDREWQRFFRESGLVAAQGGFR